MAATPRDRSPLAAPHLVRCAGSLVLTLALALLAPGAFARGAVAPARGMARADAGDTAQVASLSLPVASVVEGDTLALVLVAAGTAGDPTPRTAHLLVSRRETSGAETPLAPASVGLPDSVSGLVAGETRRVPFTAAFPRPNDGTRDRITVIARAGGAESAPLEIVERVTPAMLLVPPSVGNYWPKDFAIVRVDSLWHAFFILTNQTPGQPTEDRFGHATSPDLCRWTFQSAATLFAVDPNPNAWDHDHVWAPSVVESSGTFYLFYTGVHGPGEGVQAIGVATTTDRTLRTWTRLPANPVWSASDAPWANAASGAFRDPFVMPAGDLAPGSRWLMTYTTHPLGPDPVTHLPVNPWCDGVVGIALSRGDSLSRWSDAGPLWMTRLGTHTVESPHLLRHGPWTYVLSTDDDDPNYECGYAGGLRAMVFPSLFAMYGYAPFPLLGGDPAAFASESWSRTYPDGSQEDFLGHVADDLPRTLHFYMVWWLPTPGAGFLLVDPLRVRTLQLSSAAPASVPEGAAATLTVHTGNGDGRARHAAVEVFAIDGAARRPIAPESVGLPNTLVLASADVAIPFTVHAGEPDPDATPDRTEIVVRVNGVESPELWIDRAPAGVGREAAHELALHAPSPNPARTVAHLAADVPASAAGAAMELAVFDALGRRVRSLAAGAAVPGPAAWDWDLRDARGARVSPGLYLVRWSMGGERAVRRVMVVD